MPELPEIESLRRTLTPRLLNLRVAGTRVLRPDVVRTGTREGSGPRPARSLSKALLYQDRLVGLKRLGKQLALISRSGRCVCVHLGMSGRLSYVPAGAKLPAESHIHVVWRLRDVGGRAAGRIFFRDPRRFGGLWCFSSFEELREIRWKNLGPDALTIRRSELRAAVQNSGRPIKALLLDQKAVAGVGNIYADEALHQAGIHPERPARSLAVRDCERLFTALRLVLEAAIDAGGTTLRDYRDGLGAPGRFAARLRVYGRSNQPCLQCGYPIERGILAQRSAHFCSVCQI